MTLEINTQQRDMPLKIWKTRKDKILNFGFLKCFQTHFLRLSFTKGPLLAPWWVKKVPWPVAYPMGKMSSWQPNNNDQLLCTRWGAIPKIIQRAGIYGAKAHGKIIWNWNWNVFLKSNSYTRFLFKLYILN